MTRIVPAQEKARELAWRLRSSREDLAWNQEELAEKSGISRSYISGIESGRAVNVTIDIAFALADALGVSRAYIVGLTEDPYGGIPDSKLEQEELDTLTKEFIIIFQQLSDDKKGVLLNLARVLRSTDEPRIIGGTP